jgi:formate hydrogenlyase transcriptional activator
VCHCDLLDLAACRIACCSKSCTLGRTVMQVPAVNLPRMSNGFMGAVILTRSKSLEAPLGELRRMNPVELPPVGQHPMERVTRERTSSGHDKTSVADEYERKQRDEIIRALTACKGRVGGADGAAAHLGMNRTTFLSRMKKFGICAKQYA